MLEATDKPDAIEVSRLLAGAAKTVRAVRYCWLATAADEGFTNLRPMGRLLYDGADGSDDWTIRFITDGRSRKAAEMRRVGTVAIIFQHDPDDAFVTLIGKATLCDSEAVVRQRWKAAYGAYFPTEQDRANAVFVDVEVECMELWIRGITPEPFGMRATNSNAT